MKPVSIRWEGGIDGRLWLLDQTRLPLEVCESSCHDVESVWEAIRSLRVRGAPAIGIASAYGVVLAAQLAPTDELARGCHQAIEYLATSRPTAVNLFWALERMRRLVDSLPADTMAPDRSQFLEALLAEARAIHDEDRQLCRAIGRHGAALVHDGANLLTHCNTGGLATAEYGTALSVIFTAHDEGKAIHVYVDETRPLLQGARLTAWELQQHGVPATLICDSVAALSDAEGASRSGDHRRGSDRGQRRRSEQSGNVWIGGVSSSAQHPVFCRRPLQHLRHDLGHGVGDSD